MSDIMTQTEEQTVNQPDELSLLKQRARIMGIAFSNNIGAEALRAKINEKMDEEPKAKTEANPLVGETEVTPVRKLSEAEQIRADLMRDKMKLIRLRITNLNPGKKELPGEIFTVANEYIGTVRKYVPYGEVTNDGYHVPYCIYEQLKDRKFQNIRTNRNRQNGQITVSNGWVNEFALEILPLLTKEELSALATAQAAAGTFNAE